MPFALRSSVRQLLSMLVVWSAAGCHKLDDDDCQLSNTCHPEELFALYGEAVSDRCEKCLKDHCRPHADACFANYRCSRTVQCMVAKDPLSYQKCLVGLRASKISTPQDTEGTWEGDPELFRVCMDTCQSECERDQSIWTCAGEWREGKTDVELTAEIAVRLYRSISGKVVSHMAAPGVLVRECTGDRLCSSEGALTNDAGVVTLTIGSVSVDALYFALESRNPDLKFPSTYFYPGRLSSEPEQPIAIYLVSTDAVKLSNLILLADAGVEMRADGTLNGAAQSLILPDACREQEKPSALEVTLQARVMDTPVQRCEDTTTAGDSVTAIPCVWYGDRIHGYPEPTNTSTQGWGGGIVGLSEGPHDVRVCDRDGNIVARRRLWMEPGWLTIARTWPLSESAKKSAGECDAPDQSLSIPDARAN
jgi:hypothetical protein